MEYSEKLKDPRWQKKRLEILERDNWACQGCGDDESTLFVHHRTYITHKEPWEYDDFSLVTLCENCHSNEREFWPEYEKHLLFALKSKFLSDGLYSLVLGFEKLKLGHAQEVVASMLKWILSNDDIQKELLDRFLNSLGKEE